MGSLRIVLWKCWLVRKRRLLHTFFEFFSSLVIFIIIFMCKNLILDFFGDMSEGMSSADRAMMASGPRRIIYTPHTEFTDTLMDEVSLKLDLPRLDHLPGPNEEGYAPFSELELIANYSLRMRPGDAIVIFQDTADTSPKKLNYTIRMKAKRETAISVSDKLLYEPFTRLQWAIDTSYLGQLTGGKIDHKLILRDTKMRATVDDKVSKQKQKEKDEAEHEEHIEGNLVYFLLGEIIGKCCCFALLINFTFFTTRLIEEKNSGIQELMKMVGVTANSLYLANLINVIPGGIIFCFGVAGLLKLSSRPIFPRSSYLIIMLMLWLHFMSIMAFACFVAYLLNTKRPTLVCTLVYICTIIFVPFAVSFVVKDNTDRIFVEMTGIFPNEPISWFFTNVGALEAFGYGATSEYLSSMPDSFEEGSNMPYIGTCYVWLMVQTIVFLILAWYLSHVRPGPFGEGLPPYFLCTKNWWSRNPTIEVIPPEESELNRPDPQFFEPSPKLPIGIQVIDVTKVFPHHVALSHVTLDVFKGEITLLLGHNGAGKTTLMNIITGLMTPTTGRVLINGIDTRSKRNELSAQLGLCPQHNLFFPDLTVREHVMFFTMLKGGSRNTLKQYTTDLLATLNLLEKAKSAPYQLSGGMQRRLQLACALAGGASVLVLDEPTSGLDVETRRELWDLLLRLKGEHTMLLTTHHMEEADALADRVAALHSGFLKCHATPLFLKRAIGGGYRLSFTTTGAPDEAAFTAVVKSSVPEASVRDRALKAISYNLPSKASAQFPTLFSSLEAKRDELGISSMGVGKSTLDEVFLRLCSDVSTKFETGKLKKFKEPVFQKVAGARLCARQFMVLLKRQFLYVKFRKFSFLLMDALVPFILLILLVKVSNYKSLMDSGPPIPQQQLEDPLFDKKLPSNTAFRSVNYTRYRALPDDGGPDLLVGYEAVGSNNPKKAAALRSKQRLSDSEFNVKVDINSTHAEAVYGADAHHAPVAVNLLSNVLARRSGASITTKNHPLPNDYRPYAVQQLQPKGDFGVFLWGLLTSVMIQLMLLENISLPTRERVTRSRHIHQMCGCPLVLYWLVTFTFVLIKAALFLLLPFVIGCLALDTDNTIDNFQFIGSAIICLTLGILAFTAFTFVISTRLSLTSTNFIVFAAIFFFGFLSPLVEYTTVVPIKDDPAKQVIVKPRFILVMIRAILPTHAMSMAIINCGNIAVLNALCCMSKDTCPQIMLKFSFLLKYFDKEKCCASSSGNYESYFNLNYGAGEPVIMLVCQTVFFFVWLILIESGIFLKLVESFKRVKLRPTRFNDAVVKAEEAYVAEQIERPKQQIEDAVLVHDLHKKYSCFLCFKEFMAVNRTSFSVKKGECFGLLGVNGAGKSTTFTVLNGECYPSYGKVFSCGYFFQLRRGKYMQTMSYCPQYFGLDDFLTGRENLNLVLTLRGFNAGDVKEQTLSWIEEVGLTKYADRRVKEYSGGCARRLAAAAALCQHAPVALLDEPTAGVDTAARRRLHLAILRAKRRKSIIVASHSMDEMEALCDRMCIMSGGQIAALGSAGDLRSRHAQGFSALFKLLDPSRTGGTTKATDNTKAAKTDGTSDASADGTMAAKADGTTEDNLGGTTPTAPQAQDPKAQFIANMRSTFDCTIVDEHTTQIQFHINNVMPYSELFTKMESLKQAFPQLIEDYIVSETTLEEVFMAFAKEAKREKEGIQAKNK